MKKLFLLHGDLYEGVQIRLNRFEEACKKHGVALSVVDDRTVNYLTLPKLSRSDLLYKVSDFGPELETQLINDQATTFYKKNPTYCHHVSSTDFTYIHTKAGVAQPKTITHCNTIDRTILSNYVEYLNGFPLILKIVGLSRGIGVIKIDSWHTLISTVDYFFKLQQRFVLREYIASDRVARIMVLGENVIASWYTTNLDDDFRNSGHVELASLYKKKVMQQYDQVVEQLAIRAVDTLGLEFGAVDIIFDKDEEPHVLEVNFPCGLTFDPSGENRIVDQMIEYLVEKSRK